MGQTVNWDFRLSIGQVIQEVSVQAEALQVQSETSSVGRLIDEQKMTTLLFDERSFVALATLGKGSVPAYQDRSRFMVYAFRLTYRDWRLSGAIPMIRMVPAAKNC
jgi:hypothetical protein